MSLEMSKGAICVGEGREVPSRTGHDPWVLTEVGVKRGSFSILPVKSVLYFGNIDIHL